MIYVTGDTHADFRRFSTSYFPEQKEMTKQDFVIICGDFGGVWLDSREEQYWLNWLNDKPFTTLFVDGNHENFDRLNSGEFEQVDFCGGQVHKIRNSIFHLMRGHVFYLQDKSFFAFGGASSHDISDGILDPNDFPDRRQFLKTVNEWNRMRLMFRVKGISWWPEELPSEDEMTRGKKNLVAQDYKVDYVIAHCLPQEIASVLSMGAYEPDTITTYFNTLLHEGLRFDKWFCGHYHVEQTIYNKFEILYPSIRRIL